MQLINQINQIFRLKELPLWLKVYEIIATGEGCGLVEMINDAMSIDAIKQKLPKGRQSLKDYFSINFGPEKGKLYKKAIAAFSSSLAAYSLVCYILQIKDRHNGNIMIDSEGHIMHIDYGFILSIAPGKGLKFEKAPFKFKSEYLDLLGGASSK